MKKKNSWIPFFAGWGIMISSFSFLAYGARTTADGPIGKWLALDLEPGSWSRLEKPVRIEKGKPLPEEVA